MRMHEMVTEQEVRDRLKYLEGFREQVSGEGERALIDAQCQTLRWVLTGTDNRPEV